MKILLIRQPLRALGRPALSQCIVPVFFPPQPSDADPATHQSSTMPEINQQHDGLFQQAEEERKRLMDKTCNAQAIDGWDADLNNLDRGLLDDLLPAMEELKSTLTGLDEELMLRMPGNTRIGFDA
ncbi:hypothetical protein EJ110_NYTH44189 [Nymphaea thermarum]|nr:hypothetical protein EJ110_NYTH44189 [Nymphaea thermarum]